MCDCQLKWCPNMVMFDIVNHVVVLAFEMCYTVHKWMTNLCTLIQKCIPIKQRNEWCISKAPLQPSNNSAKSWNIVCKWYTTCNIRVPSMIVRLVWLFAYTVASFWWFCIQLQYRFSMHASTQKCALTRPSDISSCFSILSSASPHSTGLLVVISWLQYQFCHPKTTYSNINDSCCCSYNAVQNGWETPEKKPDKLVKSCFNKTKIEFMQYFPLSP